MNAQQSKGPLVRTEGLTTTFGGSRRSFLGGPTTSSQAVRAVDHVDIEIERGELVALVGESGSGKTTLGRALLGMSPITAGKVYFDGRDVSQFGSRELRQFRRHAQMIYQDAQASLSPRLRISALLTEPYRIHRTPLEDQMSPEQMLELVGLPDGLARKFPHEISGGQARRVGIARALALRPHFLVADEPTAGLDVSVAASIFQLMRELADRMSLTYLVVTHNVNLASYLADKTAVMYLGRIVEFGPTDAVMERPAHPYTKALLGSLSVPDPAQRRGRNRIQLLGETPDQVPAGCRFHTRCQMAVERCRHDEPSPTRFAGQRIVECHLWQETLGTQQVHEGNAGNQE